MAACVLVEKSEGVGILTMNRPEQLSAMNHQLKHMGSDLEAQWANERVYITKVARGAKAEAAFPEFIARRGRPLSRAWSCRVTPPVRGLAPGDR